MKKKERNIWIGYAPLGSHNFKNLLDFFESSFWNDEEMEINMLKKKEFYKVIIKRVET